MLVRDVINRLLPDGTDRRSRPSFQKCPVWPPDLFAVVASLISASGCYAEARYAGGLLAKAGCFGAAYMRLVDEAGEQWSRGMFPAVAQELWEELLRPGRPINGGGASDSWQDAAMKLLAIADVASAGFGFGISDPAVASRRPLAKWVFEQMLGSEERLRGDQEEIRLRYLPESLCIGVPPSAACVQPKTRTPQVGCTIRALSHNLALLPPAGDVKTKWHYAAPAGKELEENDPFNLLLVPFPYRIVADCFSVETRTVTTNRSSPRHRSENVSFFTIEQQWLALPDAEAKLAHFIIDLVGSASNYVGQIHGIVMPELALNDELAKRVAARVADRCDIELFITGISSVSPESGLKQNRTYCEIFKARRHHASWVQSKHHRWKLDRRQVQNYNLAHRFKEGEAWFEEIDVVGRECSFHVFREGGSLVVLVCEDLARTDPVQSVVRAIGPNLVIALLMDGPQLERRWPGRYATVLADDPGSAVLTLTSMGLMRRTDGTSNQIGLWKDPKGGVREIQLPDGCHGVVLSLSPTFEEEFCSDWRSDNGGAMRLILGEVFAVKVEHGDMGWLSAR